MQSLSSRIFSLLSVLFFAFGIGLRIAAPLFGFAIGINIVFYACAVLSVVFILLSELKESVNQKAFEVGNKKLLTLASYLSAIGFFVDFVHQAVSIYMLSQNDGYKLVSQFIPPCIACAMALAACFYFFTVGMSYADFGYDFKKLRVLHIVPILWAMANTVGVMNEVISPLKDVNSVIKYTTFIVAIIYFYFFAREIENEESVRKSFVVFSKMFSLFSIMFIVDEVMLVLTNNARVLDKNSIFAVSTLLISTFAFLHQRSI